EHAAVLLQNGKVLVTGGSGPFGTLSSAEIFDPALNSWSSVPSMTMSRARSLHALAVLPDGRVIAVGGGSGCCEILRTSEIFDPASNSWTGTGSLVTPRQSMGVVTLPDGQIFVAGGEGVGGAFVATAEIYNPSSSMWAPAGSMTTARS